jgi:maleylacetate reductase
MPGAYFYLPLERVVFGRAAAEAVAEEAARLGAARVFVVASRTLSRETPLVRGIADALGASYAGLFDACVAHTPWTSVLEAAEAVRAARPELIVTVGGGTPIDTVKILQICLAHDVTRLEELAALDATKNPRIKPSPLRQIAVPTTLSGAEFSNLAGGTDPRTRFKHPFSGADIGARAVILDPAATRHTPPWLWLSTGVRGIDHAVEALCSVEANPYCDGLALHALRLFTEHLPRTHAAPDDLAARLACQQASWLAASTIARLPYGASHGIGHVLGALAGVPHGYTSCVMLPHVLRHHEPATRAKQRLIAEALGRSGAPAADALAALIGSLELPTTLRAVGVERAQLTAIAADSLKNRWVRTNPRPLASAADVLEILEAAW